MLICGLFEPDGKFGNNTTTALETFQTGHGLAPAPRVDRASKARRWVYAVVALGVLGALLLHPDAVCDVTYLKPDATGRVPVAALPFPAKPDN